jgi:hypothetical protein
MKDFQNLGYETEMVVLPCHGENRWEASDSKEAQKIFDERMSKFKNELWIGIAFSQGALYLQHWLMKNPEGKPIKQILLAPALYLHRQKLLSRIMTVLPSFFIMKSFAPKAFRRYQVLSAREYNILIKGILDFQKEPPAFYVPTIILIDPKDELVDAHNLKKSLRHVEFFPRPYLKKGPGAHHILFHPDYFSQDDWAKFIQMIKNFIEA